MKINEYTFITFILTTILCACNSIIPDPGIGVRPSSADTEMPQSQACTDWYSGETGEYITTTGDCSSGGVGSYIPTLPNTGIINNGIYTGGPSGGGSAGGTGYGPYAPGNGAYGSGEQGNACMTAQYLGTNPAFVGLMSLLNGLTTTQNRELGYTYVATGATISATPQYGAVGDDKITLAFTGQIDGYMHTHYTGLLSVFSGSDLRAIYELARDGRIRDTDTFTAQVVTANGTVYTLGIEDVSALITFGNQWFNPDASPTNYSNWQTFEQFFYTTQYNIKTTNANVTNELGFLRMLKGSNMGLVLLANRSNDFKVWNRLGLNANNRLTSSSCQ